MTLFDHALESRLIASSAVGELFASYSYPIDTEAFELLQLETRQAFLDGVDAHMGRKTLRRIVQRLGSNAEAAQQLGLHDPSGISHKLKSGKLAMQWSTIVFRFPDLIYRDTEKLMVAGYAQAVDFVNDAIGIEQLATCRLSDAAALLGLIGHPEWVDVVGDLHQAVAAAEAIRKDMTPALDASDLAHVPLRPQQLVIELQRLWERWHDSAYLALYLVREDMQLNDKGSNAQLSL